MPLIRPDDAHRWAEASAVAGLERDVPAKRAPGLVKVLTVGLLTAGLWPTLRWPTIWGHRRRAEAFRLAEAAGEATPRRPTNPLLRAGVWLGGGAMLGLLALAIARGELLDMLLRRGGLLPWYVLAGGVAAACLVLDVAGHRRAVARLTPAVRVGALPLPGPLFALAAIALATLPLAWLAPIVLASGTLHRHATKVMPRVMKATAKKLRAASTGPLLPPAGGPVCPTPRCQTPLPDSATFCPRCGAAA